MMIASLSYIELRRIECAEKKSLAIFWLSGLGFSLKMLLKGSMFKLFEVSIGRVYYSV